MGTIAELTNTEKLNLTCLWCGKNTSENIAREHIFSEAIGGKKKLPAGSVCKKCNSKLGFLDEALKRGHPAMLDAFQADKNIKGKIRNKKDKIRKEKERSNISGKYEAYTTKITRDGGNIRFTDANFVVTTELFVRSLHKCVANVLCYEYGSDSVRKKYPQLLDFVKKGGDVHPWSYAVSYAKLFHRLLISEPVVNRWSIKNTNKAHEVISFIHTSGIWIIGSSPSLLNLNLIEKISDSILKAHKKVPKTKKPITDWFGFEWNKETRNYIGELQFLWAFKEIKGKPKDDSLYLLTKCKICGQTNPTGICLPRDIIYRGNRNKRTLYPRNTWNHYTKNELAKLGLRIEKWDKESLRKRMHQGIDIPIENDVRKMKLINCKYRCINCGNSTKYSASDCFI